MESAGWRRNEMNCLVGDCMAGMKRGLADIGRSSRKRWFWMLKKYAPRVFASGKPKLQKSILRLTGWPLWLVNGNGRCWPAGAGRECAGGREALGSGPPAGQDGNKDASCWKMCTSYFRA